MKKCLKCGEMNEDVYAYCVNCSNKFPTGLALFLERKKWWLIGGSGVLAIVILLMTSVLQLTPLEKFLYAFNKFYNNPTSEGQLVVTMDVHEVDPMVDLIDDMSLQVDFKRQDPGLQSKMTMTLDDHAIFDMVVSAERDQMFIDLLGLYDQVLYFDNKAYQDRVGQSAELAQYIEGIDLKGLDVARYLSIIEDSLGRDIKAYDNVVEIELNQHNIMDLLKALIDEMADDETLKEVAHREYLILLEQFVEDKFDLGYMTSDDFKRVLLVVEDFENFKGQFDLVLEMALDELEDLSYYGMDNFEIDILFELDLLMNIEGIELVYETDDFTVYMYYSDGTDYAFEQYDLKVARDIEDILFDDEAWANLGGQISKNLVQTILNNKSLSNYIKGTEVYQEYAAYSGYDTIEDVLGELMYEVIDDMF